VIDKKTRKQIRDAHYSSGKEMYAFMKSEDFITTNRSALIIVTSALNFKNKSPDITKVQWTMDCESSDRFYFLFAS
jgi:hypothetical protein